MAAAKGLTDIVRLLCVAGCRLDIKTKVVRGGIYSYSPS